MNAMLQGEKHRPITVSAIRAAYSLFFRTCYFVITYW